MVGDSIFQQISEGNGGRFQSPVQISEGNAGRFQTPAEK
jgi:hypothetical protein